MIVGHLELILGPMFASKSTMLIRTINRYKSIGFQVLAINNSLNKRYNTSNISTHDNIIYNESVCVSHLKDISQTLIDTHQIIAIEETQFFEDINIIKNWVNQNKIVIATGLIGNYNQQPFENISELMSFADNIILLKALCTECAKNNQINDAPFTKRIKKSDEIILVGSNDIYTPVCRKHL